MSADITASLQHDAPRASLVALFAVAAVVAGDLPVQPHGRGRARDAGGRHRLDGGATFLFGIKVNFANFAAFPITFGIGVDYAVNIMARFRQERARRPRDALPVDPSRLVERACCRRAAR